MSKENQPYPDVNANLYGGDFSAGFDCPDSGRCKHCLCEHNPPEERDVCTFRGDCGACVSIGARIDALNALARRLKAEAKALEDEYVG